MNDPIVEEIHEIRQQLMDKYGSFENYMKHVREEEKKLGSRLVTFPPRRIKRDMVLKEDK